MNADTHVWTAHNGPSNATPQRRLPPPLPQVSVKARVPGNARLKELPQLVVEARGYGVTRTVAMADLRPRS